MEFDGKLSGIADLDKAFRNLPGSTRRKANMQALRAGAAVVRNMAEANVRDVTSSEATGYLAKNIRVYNYKKYRGNYRVAVQVRRRAVNNKKLVKGLPVRVGLYAAVLEYGKKNQPPRSWIRKAIREGKDAAVNALTREMNKRMVDAVQDAKR